MELREGFEPLGDLTAIVATARAAAGADGPKTALDRKGRL